jgi:hypothetical protein
MSFVFATPQFDRYKDNWISADRPRLVGQLCNISGFLRGLRVQMRYGELTRAPLQLLRLDISEDVVKCDWLARPSDPWDFDLSPNIRERHSSLQTLRDAIDVRALLFYTLPTAEKAHLRVYRESPTKTCELIITGCGRRNDRSSHSIHSIAMRAKLLGFRFHLEGDTLLEIAPEEQTMIEDWPGGAWTEWP